MGITGAGARQRRACAPVRAAARVRATALLAACIALSACPRPPAAAPLDPGSRDVPDVVGVVEELRQSVLTVATERGEGSGVVWDEHGHVVTNAHVVSGADTVRLVSADGDEVAADIVAADEIVDVAVLEARDVDLPPATFTTRLPDVGEWVVAIGNPLGFENTVTAGVVSGLHRAIPGSARSSPALVDLVQTDAPISPGNSGGALVDLDGRVVGINVAYIPPQANAVSIGFAIPSPTVTRAVEQLIADGEIDHPFLGVVPLPAAEGGVVVANVIADSPAARAGIRRGDVIVAFDGHQLDSVEMLLSSLRGVSPGERVALVAVRDGRRVHIDVVLGVRSSAS